MSDLNLEQQLYRDYRSKLKVDREEALPLLDELVRINPKTYLYERISYFRSPEESDLKRDDIESLIEIDPDNGLLCRARFNYHHGNLDSARKDFDKLLELRSHALNEATAEEKGKCLRHLGNCYLARAECEARQGQLQLAAADYKRASSLDSWLSGARAEFCRKNGLDEDLLDSLNALVAISKYCLIERAEFHERTGNFKDAYDDYSAAVRQFPVFRIKLNYSPRAFAHLSRAKFLHRRSQNLRAILDLFFAGVFAACYHLLLYPTFFTVCCVLSFLLPLLNKAIECFRKLDRRPNSP